MALIFIWWCCKYINYGIIKRLYKYKQENFNKASVRPYKRHYFFLTGVSHKHSWENQGENDLIMKKQVIIIEIIQLLLTCSWPIFHVYVYVQDRIMSVAQSKKVANAKIAAKQHCQCDYDTKIAPTQHIYSQRTSPTHPPTHTHPPVSFTVASNQAPYCMRMRQNSENLG